MNAAAVLGNPDGKSTPTSVDVPPTSTTIVDLSRNCLSMPERNAAPRIEFVGPFEKVRIGTREAALASISVPSSYTHIMDLVNILRARRKILPA